MGARVKDPNTGQFKEIYVKALDSMPVGTIVDYDGQASDIPTGWETYGTGQIKKTSETRPLASHTVNAYSESESNAYSCEYQNKAFGGKLLWTNSSPTSTFSNQTVELDLSDYDMIEIIYYTDVEAASWKYQMTTGKLKIVQGNYILLGGYLMITTADQAPQFFGRTAQINSTGSGTKGIVFGTGKNYSSSFSTRNASGVPIHIIGYKTGLF